ncbi:unnamed protein product [Staurois parvus]|uniref:Zinc transporter ZIP9 n=1 Tax=Staurois parvus TaxID=386267 RepID=A0ABN9FWY5_9NEOB|nr:unnamed protein product [Staurois parvus]
MPLFSTADGVALGAAVASSQVSVQVIVFFAVILHKAPAAFGLVSFLMHAGLEKKQIQKHLLAFSVAAPLLAITTYIILTMSGGSSQHRLSATGHGMLFSAGTFLYVATVHVLPEIQWPRAQSTQWGIRIQTSRIGTVREPDTGGGSLPPSPAIIRTS